MQPCNMHEEEECQMHQEEEKEECQVHRKRQVADASIFALNCLFEP